jgi:antitoxin YefM
MRNDEAHLLSSPRNAERLLRALEGARARTGTPATIEDLRAQYGLGEK